MDEATFDPKKYAELLASALPRAIQTPEEHEHFLTLAESLMDKGDALGLEERKLLELLVILIELFESQVEAEEEDDEQEPDVATDPPKPHETLQRLLEARGWDPLELNDIFGNPKIVTEVLAGRRSITKGQARALGSLFKVPPKLFFYD